MANLLSRAPSWLFSALGLQRPELPVELETGPIVTQLDAYQGGVGLATWRLLALTGQPASTAATTRIEIEADDQLTRLFWLHIGHVAGAQALAGVQLRDTILSDPLTITETNLPPDSTANHVELFGTGDPVILPPAFALAIAYPATALGESWNGRALVMETRAGFKPW